MLEHFPPLKSPDSGDSSAGSQSRSRSGTPPGLVAFEEQRMIPTRRILLPPIHRLGYTIFRDFGVFFVNTVLENH